MRGKEILVLYVLSLNCSLSYRPSVSLQHTYSRDIKDLLYRQKHSRSRECSVGMVTESESGTGTGTSGFGAGTRLLLSGISLIGTAETAFLTYSKMFSTPLGSFCTTPESCNNILNGPYSTIPFFDVPLSAVALVSYSLVALLSISPFFNRGSDTPEARTMLLFICSAMAGFSGYLMVLLVAVIHAPCNFCYLSAVLSFSLAGITWSRKVVPNSTKAFLVSASSMSLTFISSLFLFYTTSTLISSGALTGNIPGSIPDSTEAVAIVAVSKNSKDAVVDKKPAQEAPKITKDSSPRAILIGNRLKTLNAKMYGAFWCSHCNNQKQELGIQASKLFEYVECAKDGVNSQYAMCKEEKIPGFPTWQIDGKLYPGEKDLSELEKLLTAIENRSDVVASKK